MASALRGTRPPEAAGRRRRQGFLGRAAFSSIMLGLSAANAGVGLLLPALMGPATFGRYALIVTLFQYGIVFDLGLSQLMDRRLPPLLGTATAQTLQRFVGQVLWLRLYVAALVMLIGVTVLVALSGGAWLVFDLAPALLSLAGGIAFMLVLGPASVYRARSDRGMFGIISIALNLILAIGRPAGVLLDGIVGCFACLAGSYLVLAVLAHKDNVPRRADRPGLRVCVSLLAQGMPLFLTASVWAFYMTANRWVVAGMAPDIALGQFAFAANAVYLIVGAVGSLAQFYYPAITTAFATAAPWALSKKVARDFCLLAGAMAIPVAVGLLLGPFLINVLYPKFAGSGAAVQVMLLAVPSLVVSAWLMPISLSLAARPWLDGLLVYPIGLAILLAVTHAGYRLDGITGAGAGLAISAQLLLLLQMATLRTTSLLRPPEILAVLGTAWGVTVLLAGLLWLAPDGISGITHLWAASWLHR